MKTSKKIFMPIHCERIQKIIKVLPWGIISIVIGCSTVSDKSLSDDPVQSYESAKKSTQENPGADYSLDRKKNEAAMALFGYAQVDLKAGNSGKAIGELALAREYNPWHDDIKDLYVVAAKHFVSITKQFGTQNCQVLNERLQFLSDTAPDYLSQLKAESEKCGFTPKQNVVTLSEKYVDNIKVPDSALGAIGKVDYDFLGQLDRIVKKNNHNPTYELLTLAAEFISKTAINIGAPRISSTANDPNKFEVQLPIELKSGKGMSSKDYCELTKTYLESSEPNDGHHLITCKYWNSWVGNQETQYVAIDLRGKLPERLHTIWYEVPFPEQIVVAFKLKYKDRPEVIYRDLIDIGDSGLRQLDTGNQINFDYINGDLPLKLGQLHSNGQREPWFLSLENSNIVILADRKLVDGLIGISAYFDLKATNDFYLKQTNL